jgi:hypothetical protein|nr:MAG TPA: LEM-like protein [Caudoviricetes sp.]
MSATAFQRKRREEEAAKLAASKQQEELTELQDDNLEHEEVKEEVKETPSMQVNFSELTNDQIKGILDAKGIEYKARANKNELLELLQGTV